MQDYEFAGLQRQIASAPRAGCSSPTRSRSSGWSRPAPSERKLFRYPGLKEDYYLADFEPDPAVLDELGLDRETGARRRPPAAGDLRVPRPQRRSTSASIDRLAGEPEAQAVVIPRTEGQGAAVRGARRRQPDRPRRGRSTPRA